MESDQYKRLFDQPAPAQEKPPMSTAPSLVHNPSFVTEPVTPVQPATAINQQNLYQRLTRVYAEIETLAQSGKHQQGWTYVPKDAIIEQVRDVLSKNGIVLLVNVLAHDRTEFGNKGERVTVLMRFALVNADNPDERELIEGWPGMAVDYNDQALKKAITAAKRTFLEHQFLLSSEQEPSQTGNNKETEKQPQQPSQARSQPQPPPQPKTPPPAPPPANTKPQDVKTAHPRDGLVSDLKKLRDAAISAGITLMGLTSTQVQKMGVQELEKQVADTRSKVFKQIQQLEKQRFEEFGQAATPIADLSEMENGALALYVVSLHKSLKPTEKGA